MKEICVFCGGTGSVCMNCGDPKQDCTCSMNGVSAYDPVQCVACDGSGMADDLPE